MQILALEHEVPGLTPDRFKPYLTAEAAQVWDLVQAGTIREAYFRQDRNDAVLMLECADVAEAKIVLASLPLVAAGLIAFDVIPLKPYSGLARLFAEPTVDKT